MVATCPECDTDVPVAGAGLRLSELVECPSCRSELEIIALDPFAFALAPEPEEDWGE